MSDSTLNSETSDRNYLIQALENLQEKTQKLIAQLEPQPCSPEIVSKLRDCDQFAEQMHKWCENLPKQRIYEAVFALLRQVDRLLVKSAESGIVLPDFPCTGKKTLTAPSLIEIAVELGPPIKISTDHMAAFVCVPPGLSHVWTEADIKQALDRNGITHGIVDASLAKSLDERWAGKYVSAALGQLPKAGQSAEIGNCTQLYIPFLDSEKKNDRITKNGNIHFFVTVHTKQPLFRKIHASGGEHGFDVFGTKIPSLAGLDLSFPRIPNCILNPEGNELWSVVNGFAYIEDKRLTVSPSLIVKRDVDYASGAVKSMVAVTVMGDVKAGFEVASGSDIAVEGTIESANIQAKGTLFCHGGIDGGDDRTTVTVGKDLFAKHLRSTDITAGENVTAQGPIERSVISARNVTVAGDDGRIVGGRIKAWHVVSAFEIGSKDGARTQIVLGGELSSLRASMDELDKSLKEKEEKRQENLMILRTIKTMKFGKAEEESEKIKADVAALNIKIKALKEKITHISKEIADSESAERMVCARKAIYPGTVIRILGRTLNVRDELGAATIIMKDGKLVTVPNQERSE